jgi:hypothetical protein
LLARISKLWKKYVRREKKERLKISRSVFGLMEGQICMQSQKNEQTLIVGLRNYALLNFELLVAGLLRRAFHEFNKTAIKT